MVLLNTKKLSKAFALCVLSISLVVSVFAQANNEQAKETPPKFQVKLFEVKYKNANTLANAINALSSGQPGSRIDPNSNLKTITVRDLPENITAIETALKRLDVPDAAPISIQTQIYLIAASDEASDGGQFPKEIEPVITQLKATLKYKNYHYVNTFINRVTNGGNIESSGTGDFKLNSMGGNPSYQQYKMTNVQLISDNVGKELIYINKFNIGVRVPIQVSPTNLQYQDVGLTTDLSLSEGGLVVVGTANVGVSGGAIIVILSAKKVK